VIVGVLLVIFADLTWIDGLRDASDTIWLTIKHAGSWQIWTVVAAIAAITIVVVIARRINIFS
jgi:hypothetical protein